MRIMDHGVEIKQELSDSDITFGETSMTNLETFHQSNSSTSTQPFQFIEIETKFKKEPEEYSENVQNFNQSSISSDIKTEPVIDNFEDSIQNDPDFEPKSILPESYYENEESLPPQEEDTIKRRNRNKNRCVICGHRCKKAEELKSHVETAHEGQKPFKCPNCDADFTNEISMKKHYSMKHKEKEKTFKCSTCFETFRLKSDLAKHNVTVHGMKKPHKCPQCQDCFAFKHHLKRFESYKFDSLMHALCIE